MNTVKKYWRYLENVVFIYAFFSIIFSGWVIPFFKDLYQIILGEGSVAEFLTNIKKHIFQDAFTSIIWEIIFLITFWEVGVLLYEGIKQAKKSSNLWAKLSAGFNYVAKTFKPTFLATFVGGFIPLLIKLDVFEIVKPFFNKFSFFIIDNKWYSWVYAYFIWELSTWVWHYSFHRVRFFWCFHSPHHAPGDLTITTAWVHFFAEGYITTFMQWIILSLAGVRFDIIFTLIWGIEVSWGTFIHLGERTLKTGCLGFLKYFLITPSHHRVHHAKNPLYMDTNFCTFLPFWDWLFGTLQPLRNEVKIEYGITRKIDVTNFMDFYFGEFWLLFQDIKNEPNFKNRFLYLIKPPGWQPQSNEHTAAIARENFLKENPTLSKTSRNFLFSKLEKNL